MVEGYYRATSVEDRAPKPPIMLRGRETIHVIRLSLKDLGVVASAFKPLLAVSEYPASQDCPADRSIGIIRRSTLDIPELGTLKSHLFLQISKFPL